MVIAAYRLLHSRKEMAMVSVFLMAIKPSSRASLVATFPSQCMGMEEMGASLGLVIRVSSAPARLSQRSAAITAPSPAPGPRPRPRQAVPGGRPRRVEADQHVGGDVVPTFEVFSTHHHHTPRTGGESVNNISSQDLLHS